MTILEIIFRSAAEKSLLITLIVGLSSLLYAGRVIYSAIQEMKPDVKKIPMIEKNMTFLDKTLDHVGGHINKVEGKLERVEGKLEKVEGKFNDFIISHISQSNSPRVLNDFGWHLVQASGIGSIVEENREKIYRSVLQKEPTNAYRAEQAVIEAVQELASDPQLVDNIENGSYNSGHSKHVVLFAGALYIRDKILSQFNFNPGKHR